MIFRERPRLFHDVEILDRESRSDEKQRSRDCLVGCWLACRYEEVRDPGTK